MEYTLQHEITGNTKVVLMDDDPIICSKISTYLSLEGFRVDSFKDLSSLGEHLKLNDFDIGIFSLDSTELGITHFLNKNNLYRRKGIVFTTDRTDQMAKMSALKEGADHCIFKPFEIEELSFLILNLAMRITGGQKRIWILDRTKWELISPDSKCIKLTNLEKLIVEKLAESGGGVISKDDIAVALGYSPLIYDFRRLEMIIRRLRTKAKLTLGIEIPLKTANRRGYAFTDNIKVLDH